MPISKAHPPTITFLLGKPLHHRSVVTKTIERLHHSFPTITLHHARENEELPPWLLRSDLIVQKGLGPSTLAAAKHIEDMGVRCCNAIAATHRCCSRLAVSTTLGSAGLPIPVTRGLETWPGVLQVSERQPIVVKRDATDIGRGAQVVIARDSGDLPTQPPFPGPYVVEEYIPNVSTVHKLYVVKRKVRGLLKQSHPTAESPMPAIAFDVEDRLRKLAHRTSEALGLEIFGMDVLLGREGPVLIDVNPFPGFRGVDDAARLIANHITSILLSLGQ